MMIRSSALARIFGGWRRRPEVYLADATAVRARLERCEATLVLDVRGREEFRGPLGHVAGSVNVPLTELSGVLPGLPRDRRTILVCRTDKRSAKAAEMLSACGWADVAVLKGGMEEWNRLGFPVER